MKKITAAAICVMLSAALPGCTKAADVPEFSGKYLVGTSWGGKSWGEFYDCISANVIVCKNHELLVYMPAVGYAPNHSAESELVATLTLTEAQYAAIENALDQKRLYTLDPKEDTEVCDGYYSTLTLYGADDAPLKSCGGYMPQSSTFNRMHNAVLENLPQEELDAVRTARIEELRAGEMQE